MQRNQAPSRGSRSLGASSFSLVIGLVALVAVGLVLWRYAAPADLPDEGADDVGAAAMDELLGKTPEGDFLDPFRAAAEAAAARGNGLRPDEARRLEGEQFTDLSRQEAEDATARLAQMAESGQAELSDEARAIIASGGVIPAHWVRFMPDGKLVVRDPGVLTPGYAAIEAPLGTIVRLPGGGLPTEGTWRGKPALEDLDGDGVLDIVASLRMWHGGDKGEGLHVWLSRDGGHEEHTRGLRRDLGYGGVDVADLDGDGRLDLAFACHNGFPRAYLSNGFVGVDEGVEVEWTEVSSGLEPMGVCTDVEIADFTGDGRADIACIGLFSGTGGLYVYSYDPEARAWFVQAELLPVNDYGYQVRAADVDGDGRMELIAATNRGPKVYSFVDGAFVDRSRGLPIPVVGGTLLQVLPRDFDGDGVMELLTLGLHHPQVAPLGFHRLVDGVWEPIEVSMPQTESIRDAEFVEIDGDDGVELLLLGLEGMMLAEVDIESGVRVTARLGGKEQYYHLEVGDLNGDGLDDAVVVQKGGVVLVDLAASAKTVAADARARSTGTNDTKTAAVEEE